MRSEWVINLAAWIVQDGNYGDFHVGQRAEFALEFASERRLEPTEPHRPSTTLLNDGLYEVRATVSMVQDGPWVIDCEVLAYSTTSTSSPAAVAVGETVAGTIGLGVDPFNYFEGLAERPGMPPLIYTWCIESIRRQAAPWLKGDAVPKVSESEWSMAPSVSVNGQQWIRDPSRRGWVEIEATNAWSDDNGFGEYLLTCRLLDDVPAKRTSVTAAS